MQTPSTPPRKPLQLSPATSRDALYCALDIVAFAAQVLAAYDATLRGRPFVVVSQDEASHKSTAIACSAEALALGISCGMPMHVVQRRWPAAAILRRDERLEAACREEIALVLERYSPQYEVHANGSCLVNLSRTPAQRTMEKIVIGEKIRVDVMAAAPLSAIGAGLGSSEAAARIMARTARPNGVAIGNGPSDAQSIAGLDTGVLPGLSGQCREKLVAYGLRRIGQVQALTKDALVRRFGSEGEKLYSLAVGGTVQTIVGARHGVPLRALHAETVLENDINDTDIIIQNVRRTADKLCFLLKNNDAQTRKFTLTIAYSDNKKSQKTVALPQTTNDFLTIARYAQLAFTAAYQRRVAIRSVNIGTKDIRPDPCQTSLLETAWEQKQAALSRQIVKVRNENSFETVVSAAMLRKSL